MNYSEIKYYDIANGPGVRTSLFVSGCRNACPGCFNAITWAFDYGNELDAATSFQIATSLDADYIEGLTILGGEPLEPENQQGFCELLEQVRAQYPAKSLWLYTGFTFEELMGKETRAETEWLERILAALDVLVDGRFVEAQKDISLRFRGSSNQRLIDVPKTLAAGSLVAWEDQEIYSTHTM